MHTPVVTERNRVTAHPTERMASFAGRPQQAWKTARPLRRGRAAPPSRRHETGAEAVS